MIGLDDNSLMLSVKAGKTEKLSLLYERHKGPLYGFFYRLTTDRDISEDLVQNVFLRILKYRHTYNGSGKFTTWYYHLARNVLADHYRKNNRYQPMGDEDWSNRLSHRETAEAQMTSVQDKELLQKAMRQLSKEKQELLVLVKFQQLRYEQVAALMDCSVGALIIKSERGEIFSDFDMEVRQSAPKSSRDGREFKIEINAWVYGDINGGGPEYAMQNMNGNIYIRRK